MAITATLYDSAHKILCGEGDWPGDTIKLALVDSTYTPSAAHDEWADASGDEITGTNYTAGGESLANKSMDNDMLDADDVTWTNLTATFRYAILYISGTKEGLTNPLLAYYLLDDTPADVSVSASDYTIPWSASGVMTL